MKGMTMRILLSMLLVFALSLPAYAGFSDSKVITGGGFKGPISGALAETVEATKKLDDKARVVLVGHIVSRLAGARNEYVFRDDTGEITVEISDKLFRGLEITPQDKVRISGKVDKDLGKEVEVDVKVIEKLD